MFTQLKKYWFHLGFILILLLAIWTRFYQLMTVPPSLYWEEAALGYDAYSILKTGHDHHGHAFPVVAFESFGDNKPVLYFYAILPFMAVLGGTDLAVRLPSATAGVLIVIGVGCLARALLQTWGVKSKHKLDGTQLVGMAMTAISPWAIQFSRGGWEVNLATCLVVWAVYFGVFYRGKNTKYRSKLAQATPAWPIYLSLVLFALSMYTYHSTRVISPFLALVTVTLYWFSLGLDFHFSLQQLSQKRLQVLKVIVAGLFFLVITLPLILALGDKRTQQRFAETSLFADGKPVLLSNYYRQVAGNVPLKNLFFHRDIFYVTLFTANYLKHFDLKFLFISGDANPRHSTQYVGQMYPIEVLFVAVGILELLKHKNRFSGFLVFWLLIGIVPAALTVATPHALRILPTMAVFMILVTLGVVAVYEAVKSWCEQLIHKREKQLGSYQAVVVPSIVVALCLLYTFQFAAYWRYYWKIYPKVAASEWQYGYKQLVAEIAKLRQQYPDQQFYITREQGRPAMYYWFYTQTDPRLVQAAEPTAKKDQGEFLEFQNMEFINTVNEAKPGIIASSPEGYQQLQTQQKKLTVLDTVHDPLGKVVWVVYELQEK